MFDWFGDDEEDEDRLSAERQEEIDEILSAYDERFEEELGGATGRVESREYQEYKEAEQAQQTKTWYERLVSRLSPVRFTFDDLEREQRNAIALLNYDIDVGEIGPAASIVSLTLLIGAVAVMAMTALPAVFKIGALLVPFTAFYYLIKYPALKANEKVVGASEDLVLAVLYMVIYMRSSPNLEGAVSFAARHLSGPVAQDFKRMLWEVDVRKQTTIEQALNDYIELWRPYNLGFVEALNLIQSATAEPDPESRNAVLTEAIDQFLDHTREKMDDYAGRLKLPVMVFYGIGILLPVLGIILFPMIATFLGGGNTVYYLVFLYNIFLPVLSYAVMKNMLVSRPISFAPGELVKEAGKLRLTVAGRDVTVSAFLLSIPLFLLLMAWPAPHYYNVFFGGAAFPPDPSPATLLREMMFVLALGIPAGLHLVLGYRSSVEFQGTVREIEQEFPQILYQLSKQLERGDPVEVAVREVAGNRDTLTISDLFARISQNIREAGMTFEEAVFDPERGAIHAYPSDLVATVMEIAVESAEKGTAVTARALENISNYLQDIHHTEERLEKLLEETVSSVTFLGFVLAPVIAGVAVGMGSVISLAFTEIGRVAGASNRTVNASAPGSGSSLGATSIPQVFDFGAAIPPGMLQLIVGIYVLQLAVVLGTFLVRLKEGRNPAKRNHTIGKIILSSLVFYTLVVLIVVTVFGGIIQGALQ